MFRALFSVAIVLLLSTIALLLYANYVHEEKPAIDLVAKGPPPAPAPKIEPMPPVQPPPPTEPAVQPRPPKEVTKHEQPKPKHPEPAPGQRSYVVEAGDSLWNISMKTYGSGDYTGKIAELNHLAAKDRIRPGQVLLLPDLPKRESKPESLSRLDEGVLMDQLAAPVEGSEAKLPENESPMEQEPVKTTNRTETPQEDSEIQPPMLNIKASRP